MPMNMEGELGRVTRRWVGGLGDEHVAARCIINDHAPGTSSSASVRSVTNMWPGACVMASGRRASISAAWGVTPQAQKTGT